MAGRLVVEAGPPSSPASVVTSKLKHLVDIAKEAAILAGGAEAALLGHADEGSSAVIGGRRRADLRDWLHAFRWTMCDLDDAIDDHNTCVTVTREQLQQQGEGTRSIRNWFRSSRTAVHESEYKKLKSTVEKLNKKMQDILQQGRQLHLEPINSKEQRCNSRFLGDTSYYNIVGDVEYQKQDLIAMLTDKQSTSALENDRCTSHIVVIVGCGGKGKTTLAQKVIDDHHTRNAFGTILWVHGSKDFTDMELLSAIASAAGIKAGQARSREKIEEMLASKLEGKRVLLVLDDVWSHQIYENYLETCLPVQHGSRILMTAWDRSVAEQVKSAQTYDVKELAVTECSSLLSRSCCMDAEELNTSFKEIWETLIEKCRRVPLAIKLIGGVLRTKDPTLEEWQKVISECVGWSTNDIPDGMKDIAGPIRVAYNDLPSHLKQCFLYCLYLPEGIMISRLTVTRLWTSEGLIEEQEGCNPEDTAEEYYNELLLRNLLQPKIGSDEMELCTLHGCVRSVLQLLTKDFWTGKMSSISSKEEATLPCFRTVILHKNSSGDRVLDRLSRTVKYLRVLDLNGTGITNIPGSMEPLLHLRFLNLSYTDIIELPESIGSLRNLRFLILQYCYRLHSLPDGISKLQNLRTLDLEGTTPRLVLPGLASLKQLTVLRGFIVNSNEATENDICGWPFEDLRSLISLRSLQIVKIERIQQHLRARSELSMNSQLTQLELCGSARKFGLVAEGEDRSLSKLVLSSLQPPQCLESLKIVGYHGQALPKWILDLQNLKHLVIADCNFFERLPALGQLPQLKLLNLSRCSELRAIERGQTWTRVVVFPKLEQLHLDDMQSLQSWEGFEAGDLPVLVEFHLKRCPRLKSLPPCLEHCRLLKGMLIVSADSLEAIDSLLSLRELVVQDSKSLASISNLPALEVLTIVDCLRLQNVSGLKLLKHLRLVDRELTGLPSWLTCHGSVPETLTIVGREVMLGSLVPGGKDWPAISGIGKVYGNLPEGSPFFTYTKHTAILESFGDRRDLINLADATNGNIASSVVALQLKSWWPRVMLANFVRRISQIRMPATKRQYLLCTLTMAICPLLFLPKNRYIEPFSNQVLLVFLAYIGMLSLFLWMWAKNTNFDHSLRLR